MRKIIFTIACTLVLILLYPRVFSFVYQFVPAKWWTERVAYAQVRDPYQPSIKDFKTLQKYLTEGRRPALDRLGDMKKRGRNLCLIGDHEMPESGTIAVNCREDEKENCLLVYASFNKAYPQGLKKLIDLVSKSDFKGHILYRIGGWPNLEEGDLKLAHIPYAFKPCFFREAKRLGYQRALWLDASITPVTSLNTIFQEMAQKGYFVMGNNFFVGPYMDKQAADYLGFTMDACASIPSCSSGLFGVDFSHPKATEVLDAWYTAAKKGAFFSPRPDQNALSILLYQRGMTDWAPLSTLAHEDEPISEHTLFKINRKFVQKW